MGRQREDIRAAMELLLTPMQYDYIMSSRGRAKRDLLRILINDGLRYRMANHAMQERYLKEAQELLDRLREASPEEAAYWEELLGEPAAGNA